MGLKRRLEGEDFETRFDLFWREQVRGAEGQRLEMLGRELTGTKLLLGNVVIPVLGSFDGLMLEYDIMSASGVKIYADVCHPIIRLVMEEDHYITHAEKVTRERFSFERSRARTFAILGYAYFPYSRDELEKKPELCQRNLEELLVRIGAKSGAETMQLPVYEREVLRCALLCSEPFRLEDASRWLHLSKESSSRVMHKLAKKGLVDRIGGSDGRCHAFVVSEKGTQLLLRH